MTVGEKSHGPALPLTHRFEWPSETEWRRLRGRMPAERSFFATTWAKAWCDTYLPYDRWRGPVRCLTVRAADGLPTGALPLAVLRFGPVRFAACAGLFMPFRSLALDLDPALVEPTCAAMADALVRSARLYAGFRLGPYSSADPMVAALASGLVRRGWKVGTRRLGESFAVALPEDVAAFQARRGALVKKIAYYERRCRRTGTLDIVHHRSLSLDAWGAVLDDIARIEAGSWIARENGTILFGGPNDKRFFLRLLQDEFLASAISFWIMYLDGRPIAFSFNLDAGDTRFIVANLYDEAFAAHSPGHVLSLYVLSEAIESGRRRIDWGQGDSGYKSQWGAAPAHVLGDLIAFPPGAIGRLAEIALGRRSGFSFEPRAPAVPAATPTPRRPA